MSNPAWDDTTRDRIHQRLGYLLGLQRIFSAIANWLHPQNAYYLALLISGDEEATRITKLELTAGRVRTDTDVDGIAWGRIVDGTPNTVNIYKEQSRSTLVATGTAADGATATLAPQTGYYLAGAMKLGTISADATFAFLLLPPPYARAAIEFSGAEQDDGQNLNVAQDAIDVARARATDAALAIRQAVGTVIRTLFSRKIASVSDVNTLINPNLVVLEGGQINEEAFGLVEDLRAAQAANASGSGVIKAGAATQSPSTSFPGWTGRAAATPSLSKMAVPGVYTATCKKGLDASGPPEFEIVFTPTDTRRKLNDGQSGIPLSNRLTMGATFKEPVLGLESLTIEYAPTITNTTGTLLSATGTDWLMPAGLTSELSDEGTLYFRYELSDTTLEVYKSAAGALAQDPEELVTEATVAAASVNTVVNFQDIGNGLTLVGKTGAGTGGALEDGDRGTVNFNAPQTTQPASAFLVTVSETVAPSAWVRTFRDALGWEPHTASSPNLDDGWIEGGMPFPNVRLLGVPD